MSKRAQLIMAGLCSLLILTSCHGQHHEKKHSHSHKQKLNNNHNQSKTDKNTMKVVKPNRVSHTYEQNINGTIEEIMPLYCPVKELDWCENWNPKAVYSNSGLVEKDCVFITSHGETDIVWIVTDYDIEKGYVEMFYHVPEAIITKLEIQVTPITDEKTKAILTYTKTSLSELGDKILEEFTKESYDIMMDSWEKAMNYYLETGEILTGLPNF